MKKLFFTFFLFLFALSSCELFEDADEDPNELGGSTNVDWAQPGTKFYPSFTNDNQGHNQILLNKVGNIEKELIITENNDGIVNTHVKFTMDLDELAAIDTLLGLQDYTLDSKLIILEVALGYGSNAKLDTSDLNNITLEFDVMSKITSEGMQSFPTNDVSKPFTLVKYNASVGDKYKFKGEDGQEIVREVTYKSKDDDYEWGFWLLKVLKIEETNSFPMVDKTVYYTNHKYGFVGLEINFTNGKVFKLNII